MMLNKKVYVLKNSWSECEEALKAVGLKEVDTFLKKRSKKGWSELSDFLISIDFLDINGELTDTGKEYFRRKFVLNDDALSDELLSGNLKYFLPTQAICQLLWGRPNLTKQSIYRLLVLEEYIDSKEFKEQDLGGFLMLLNQCDILKYNKKTNAVTILFNPRSNDQAEMSTKFLSPETPYSNVRGLREAIRNSDQFVHWFDKHFSLKGFEPLHDEADGTKINEIKVLTGITSGRINDRLKDDFVRFRDEMKSRQIKTELRVICDKSILNNIHDRWIASKNSVFNVPPVDTVFQGQFSEIKKTDNRPPFEEWWVAGLDIVDKWQEIKQTIK